MRLVLPSALPRLASRAQVVRREAMRQGWLEQPVLPPPIPPIIKPTTNAIKVKSDTITAAVRRSRVSVHELVPSEADQVTQLLVIPPSLRRSYYKARNSPRTV